MTILNEKNEKIINVAMSETEYKDFCNWKKVKNNETINAELPARLLQQVLEVLTPLQPKFYTVKMIADIHRVSPQFMRTELRYRLPNFGKSDFADHKLRWSAETYRNWELSHQGWSEEERKREFYNALRAEAKEELKQRNKNAV